MKEEPLELNHDLSLQVANSLVQSLQELVAEFPFLQRSQNLARLRHELNTLALPDAAILPEELERLFDRLVRELRLQENIISISLSTRLGSFDEYVSSVSTVLHNQGFEDAQQSAAEGLILGELPSLEDVVPAHRNAVKIYALRILEGAMPELPPQVFVYCRLDDEKLEQLRASNPVAAPIASAILTVRTNIRAGLTDGPPTARQRLESTGKILMSRARITMPQSRPPSNLSRRPARKDVSYLRLVK